MPTRIQAFFKEVTHTASHAMVLEGGSSTASPLNRWGLMGVHPRRVISLTGNQLSVDDKRVSLAAPSELFARLRQEFSRSRVFSTERTLPFSGGWAGFLSYEFAPWCEPVLAEAFQQNPLIGFPTLLFCEFEDWMVWDLATPERLHVLTESPSRRAFYQDLWEAHERPPAPQPPAFAGASPPPPAGGEPELQQELLLEALQGFDVSMTPEAFECHVERLKAEIRAGELYQANLSLRLQKAVQLDPLQTYQALTRRNPSPFGGYFKWPGAHLLCNSPERLVTMHADGTLQTRPIAGTRGRGSGAAGDEVVGERLRQNPKERAEHLMLVDLARNDLGRIATAGSVQVDELLTLERYSHVTHLVSNVTGQRRPGVDAFDVLQALFPAGTITGCPKIRCMEILQAVEPVPRGFYTGSLGYLDRATGAMDFNILIRSLLLQEIPPLSAAVTPLRYHASIHAGAGIVADSEGTSEFRECLRKATAPLEVLTQQDTLSHAQSHSDSPRPPLVGRR